MIILSDNDYKQIWMTSYCLNFQNEVNLLNGKIGEISKKDLQNMCSESIIIANSAVGFLKQKQIEVIEEKYLKTN